MRKVLTFGLALLLLGPFMLTAQQANVNLDYNPQKDTEIISYEFPSGFKFNSIEEYKNYGVCGKLEMNKNFKKKVLRIEGIERG